MKTKNKNKALLMDSLERMGFNLKLQKDSKETYYHKKEVGKLKVYIVLSNQARVIIETSGVGTHYIILAKKEYKYSEVTVRTLLRQFQTYLKGCERFITFLN